jgi:hypothetical protein
VRALLAKGETPVHVHIAAKKMEDDSLVAIYVRMQGPKFDDPTTPKRKRTRRTNSFEPFGSFAA